MEPNHMPAPLLLNDPQTVWIIQDGTMGLFTVPVKDGTPAGARRYLCSIGPGQALFGTTPAPEESFALLAVPLADIRLWQVSRKALQEQFTSDHAATVALLEGWIAALDVTLPRLSLARSHVQAAPAQKYTLGAGASIQPEPRTMTWLHLLQGSVSWMGRQELSLTPASGLFPLGPGMWVAANEAVELETVPTAAVSDLHTLLAGLEQLQRLLLRYTMLLEQQQVQDDLQRFQARQQRNQQMRETALSELAAVLQSQAPSVSSHTGTPLLVAARAVGEALGMTIHPAAEFEASRPSKEPLEAMARASHVRLRSVLLTDAWWKQDCGPLLAYRQDDNQPVALLPVSATRYDLFDPVHMTRTPVQASLASTLAPVAYVFYRPLPVQALQPLGLLKFGLRDHTRDICLILLCGLITTLLGWLTPELTAVLVDQAIPDADQGLLLQIGLALLAAAFGQTLFQLAQVVALMRYQTGSSYTTQVAMWDRLLNLQPAFFRQYSTGDLLERVTAINTIRQKLSGTTMRTLFDGVMAILNLVLMFYYSWQLALVASVAALLVISATTWSGVRTVRLVRPLRILAGELSGVAVQLIQGVSKLRVAGAEERAFAYWGTKYSQQQTLRRRIQRIEDSINVFNAALPPLTSVMLFWFAMQVMQNTRPDEPAPLTVGVFLAFNTAFGTFIGGVTSLSNTLIDTLDVATLWERARPILEGVPEVDASKADPGRLMGKLAMEHVTFRYRDDGPVVLDDVSLHAAPGEFIALVGPSGSGKSTIFRLLLGFDTPESGTIYYDDQDLAHLDVYAVRRQFGIVLQHSKIMSATIFENIAAGASITLDDAWDAARAAGLGEDIAEMSMGMHTVVSEGGSNISGGQRQRLLIARALAFKPAILLFDEATSALDNRTQATVTASLDRLRVTRVVIAHRLSTIRHADRICVIDQGRIVQQGRFEELAQQAGLFAQLMARQMA
jgi:NHLM bacteriocin system ABC transporter ATP-binding protein